MGRSNHPFLPFVPDTATKLILGSIPPARFCHEELELYCDDVPFFYGSRDNAFWSLLEHIFQAKLPRKNTEESVRARMNLLESKGFGITDIIASCVHQNDSASDDDLKDIEYQDLASLLSEKPQIDTLIYTSEFVKKLVNWHFETYHSIDKGNRRIQSVLIANKRYLVKILFSPSPQALINLGDNGAQKRLKQYADFLKS